MSFDENIVNGPNAIEENHPSNPYQLGLHALIIPASSKTLDNQDVSHLQKVISDHP